ncbi:MarR family winged helix-turn-helix transcriptional regulator [Jatrophihabitans sp. YIM 134969]
MSASVLDVDPPTGETPGTTPDKLAAVGRLADQLGQTVHTLQRARAQMLAHAGAGGADWTTRVVLAKIVMTGPKRVTELAEAVGADASTVSRQVAAMVKDGLLERQADPGDGRASLLVATEDGRVAVDRFREARTRELAGTLDAWSPEDCATLADLLERFTTDISNHIAPPPAAPAAQKEQ